jgi:hypothetical protein
MRIEREQGTGREKEWERERKRGRKRGIYLWAWLWHAMQHNIGKAVLQGNVPPVTPQPIVLKHNLDGAGVDALERRPDGLELLAVQLDRLVIA